MSSWVIAPSLRATRAGTRLTVYRAHTSYSTTARQIVAKSGSAFRENSNTKLKISRSLLLRIWWTSSRMAITHVSWDLPSERSGKNNVAGERPRPKFSKCSARSSFVYWINVFRFEMNFTIEKASDHKKSYLWSCFALRPGFSSETSIYHVWAGYTTSMMNTCFLWNCLTVD